jgi:hypothetical protein
MKQQFASLPVALGDGFSVEFRFSPGGLYCEWSPDVPGPYAPANVLARYQEALAAFVLARCNRVIGQVGPVVTVLR